MLSDLLIFNNGRDDELLLSLHFIEPQRAQRWQEGH